MVIDVQAGRAGEDLVSVSNDGRITQFEEALGQAGQPFGDEGARMAGANDFTQFADGPVKVNDPKIPPVLDERGQRWGQAPDKNIRRHNSDPSGHSVTISSARPIGKFFERLSKPGRMISTIRQNARCLFARLPRR